MCLLVLVEEEKKQTSGITFSPPTPDRSDQSSGWFGFLFRTARRKKSKKPRSMSCIVDSVMDCNWDSKHKEINNDMSDNY